MAGHAPTRHIEPLAHDQYRALFDAIDEAVTVVDPIFDSNGKCVDFIWGWSNPAVFRMTGLRDVVGKRAYEIVSYIEPEWLERYGRVATTGIPERFEYPVESLDRWLSAFVSRVGGEDSRRIVVVYSDITARKRAEAALRESEERHAFLLKLSDTLRPLSDPDTIQLEGMRVLVEHIGVARAEFWEFDPNDPGYQTSAGAYAPGVAPFPQRVRSADYGPVAECLRAGETYIIRDSRTDPQLTERDRANFAAIEIGASLGLPLIKEGRLVAALGVYTPTPREWSPSDLALSAELVDRVWEAVLRARAELRLRESEARFSQFAKASSAGIWIRDAETLAMEYVSPAISAIYGVETDAFLGDMERWAAMIVPEDRAAAMEHIAQARQGESVIHEFRIQRPSDGTFRWIRNTDFPLGNGRIQRIGGLAEDITEEKLNVEHQGVLLLELQHRVRNIMAIIRSIVARTADGAASVAEYAELLSGRLLTLARVQALLTRAANAKVGIATIVNEELGAQATHAGQFDVQGPDVLLSPKAAETMTLAVHELTTNALKYGALSSPDGKVNVRWEIVEKRDTPWLSFDWVEEGAPPRAHAANPRRVGFGSELIEGRIPYELKGRGTLTIEPGGARCHMEFPLKDAASVLETDAPQRATVFGGAIDMSGQADMTGQRVLVVEDDYYLATDTARALAGTGAQVIGPCSTVADARNEIIDTRPTCAVLDINLTGSPSFDLARELKRAGVPFVFITGYDPDVIPSDLAEVIRLQKPAQFREIVAALARTL